ncbi:MAG: metalloregulator ArsR/SmtB family transcription factor [Bacillota bacterium]|nr:metalloregulator ArsR/SmtB family transcription factor [Bacillota bacterium]
MSQKKEAHQCEIFCSDPVKVSRVKKALGDLNVMVDIFKALGDETRFKIIFALYQEELCVCDLALAVEMPVAAVSYHLRYLRSLRLVRYSKQGKIVFYSLDDDHISQLVQIALAHSSEAGNIRWS